METTCSRCHQTVDADSCYCPTCGLPQLVYSSETNAGQPAQEKWIGAVSDASVVEWRPALRAALLTAIPAGLLSSEVSRAGLLGLFWMLAGAAWAVTLYVRRQRSPWITMGAGARIGLVTGVMAATLAFSVTGLALFLERFVFHQAGAMDEQWRAFVDAVFQMSRQIEAHMGLQDQGQALAQKNLMLSPEGHAGWVAFNVAGREAFLVLFAAAGGAVGARLLARSKRPRV
ncbi:MAG TPA: zinc ribbon domain-containing protein [Terracidiphilus sp.]